MLGSTEKVPDKKKHVAQTVRKSGVGLFPGGPMSRKKVWLAQQAVWDITETGKESMPLACGYLKAAADADEVISSEMDIRIFNFGGGDTTFSMIQRMLLDEVPDIIGFSVFGWNPNIFSRVAETFHMLNPAGWVIFGGTHVTDQADRVMKIHEVDVVVNGEGEVTFCELLRAYLGGFSVNELAHIDGISFKDPEGKITTTAPRDRIVDLEEIPSPFLSGAMEMVNENGEFKYDVALMETNRGCPYKCAFCFWGGAIGTKLRAFSLDRLREEIEFFARYDVCNIVLCDANFGMTKYDEQFVEIMVKAREKYHFPRSVVTSWAKNKGKAFYRIIRRMKETGFHSSFTLALQTLHEPALELMGRKNMKVNDWKDLASWLQKEGLNLYGEMIWGCPGETYESFIEGYDNLAESTSCIATYPHLMLPNTDYSKNREEFEFVTWRGGKDDFEYVLSHKTMPIDENRKMHRFLFWSRIMSEYTVLRHIWAPLRKLAGIKQSEVLLSLDHWFDLRNDPVSEGLRACRAKVVDFFDAYAIEDGLHFIYGKKELDPLMYRWWDEEIVSRVPQHQKSFFTDLFRYEWQTRPIYDRYQKTVEELDGVLAEMSFDSQEYFIKDVDFQYPMPALIPKIIRDEEVDFQPEPTTLRLHFKKGFSDYISNHEFNAQFVGKTYEQLLENARDKIEQV